MPRRKRVELSAHRYGNTVNRRNLRESGAPRRSRESPKIHSKAGDKLSVAAGQRPAGAASHEDLPGIGQRRRGGWKAMPCRLAFPIDVSDRRSAYFATTATYANSGACSSDAKSHPLCTPSQNGFFAEWPQRQRA